MSDCAIFKKCPMCSTKWESRDEFLEDISLDLNGYQVAYEEVELGLFYFTHKVKGCHTTLALRAETFYDLNSNMPHETLKKGSEDCPGYCHDKDQLDHCEVQCEGAFVREIIQIIKERKMQLEAAA